jgi:hypothetical protein
VSLERVTVESKHIANRHHAAPALPAQALEWTPAATTPAAVIGSHEVEPGARRERSWLHVSDSSRGRELR